MNKNEYININKVAEAKGLKSNRSLRLEINKPESKYIAREVKVNGGTSYEILYSSLEPEIQEKLREGNTKSTALVPLNYQPTTFVSESARLTSLARLDIVKALLNYRKKFTTKKEADSMFLDLYNSGMYLPKVFKFIGTISIGTLHRWVKSYERYENDDDSAVIGSNLDYAAIHQLGGQAGKGHKTEIPARPYLQLTDDDFAEIIDETTVFLK